MSREAIVRSSLIIRTGNLDYRSNPTGFVADVAGINGPTPGAITVPVEGVDVDFSQLTAFGGLCRLANLDDTNFLTWGIHDPETDLFYPVGKVLAGETYVLRLADDLEQELGTGSGTGTAGPSTNRLRLKADTASVVALVEAFDP